MGSVITAGDLRVLADQVLASAAKFLIEGEEFDDANMLLSCTLRLSNGDAFGSTMVDIDVCCPRFVFEKLSNGDNGMIWGPIRSAIEASVPSHLSLRNVMVKSELLVDLDPNWRNELIDMARGKIVHNQVVSDTQPQLWHNLRFRSKSEIKIAEALDKQGVFFLPNCMGRLNTPTGRQNREADFLVCHQGKWGILEVDGEPYHPPTRTVHDHDRDRLFRGHGIKVVEHYDAKRCYNHADEVVAEFLRILRVS